MLPFQTCFHEFGRQEGSFHGLVEMDTRASTVNSRPSSETKAMAASRSHSEAEKRRRERINGHLATLRTLLPNATKTDKASLLAEVVQHVKELKRHVADVAPSATSNICTIWPFPGEIDEVILDSDPDSSLIKVSVCCDDRPDLLTDLSSAIRSLRLRPVKAEIATLGGRTKSVFFIEGEGDLLSIRRTLKAVLEKPGGGGVGVGASIASGSAILGNKKPRFSRGVSR